MGKVKGEEGQLLDKGWSSQALQRTVSPQKGGKVDVPRLADIQRAPVKTDLRV